MQTPKQIRWLRAAWAEEMESTPSAPEWPTTTSWTSWRLLEDSDWCGGRSCQINLDRGWVVIILFQMTTIPPSQSVKFLDVWEYMKEDVILYLKEDLRCKFYKMRSEQLFTEKMKMAHLLKNKKLLHKTKHPLEPNRLCALKMGPKSWKQSFLLT